MAGGATSIVSSSTSFLLTTDSVPQISYSSTSPLLSEKHTYPSFLRTVPSDLSQVYAIGDLASHFNWTYVSVLASDDEYGRLAVIKLRENLRRRSICFAVDRLFNPNNIINNNNNSSGGSNYELKQITDELKSTAYPKSKVVILWADLDNAVAIIEATRGAGMNDTLWVLGTEAWAADQKLIEANSTVIKLSISQLNIESYIKHLTKTTFQSHLNNTWIRQFWTQLGFCPEFGPFSACFPMKPSGNFLPTERTENVISAVYTLAYSLHRFLGCNDTQCNSSLTEAFDYESFLKQIKRPGNRFQVPDSSMFVEFDSNGDVTVNSYTFDIYGGRKKTRTLGRWFNSQQQETYSQNKYPIQINKTVWRAYNPDEPSATCAFPCQPGTYKLPGLSACCWQCISCYLDEISSIVDAPNCQKCQHNEIPSDKHDRCIPLSDMRLSLRTGTGRVVLAFSILGFGATAFVLCVFVMYWDTPVVKSSSREISVIQLSCMMLLFAYPALHFVQTTTETCILRTVLFCSLHTLILAFILLKTYRLLRIFQPKRFSKISRFLHNKYQVMTSFLLVAVVLFILTGWYYSHLPHVELYAAKGGGGGETGMSAQEKEEETENGFIYHCGEHEDVVFYCVVAYIMLLSLASGFMAFKARRLPSNFREAQYIWLAMFTACLAWFTLFPLHITQSLDRKPVVVIGVNGAVVASTLLVLYAYKVHIVLFKPHLNSSEYFTKLAANATVATFLKEASVSSGGIASPRQHSLQQTPQQQSVISFDFDSMFDEYKKSKTRTKSFKESFRHFPRTFRASTKRKRGNTATTNAEEPTLSGEQSSSQKFSPTKTTKNEKEKRKRQFKVKNKTLQLADVKGRKRRDDEANALKRSMPPKSISFDEGKAKSASLPPSSLTTNTTHSNNNKTSAPEFFMEFQEGGKTSIAGSRSGSNVSLIIATTPIVVAKGTKNNELNNSGTFISTDQSHPTVKDGIHDSFKKNKKTNNNISHKNKLTKQKSVGSVNGTLDLSQSDILKCNASTIVDQSMEKLTHANNRSNELVKGMNSEAFDTFV